MTSHLGPVVPESLRINWQTVNERPLDPVSRLRATDSIYRNLRGFQTTLALTARTEGFTWAEIGRALGITRQAAQQRFGMGVRR